MAKKLKRAFTITELVIVIAVVAILAAVLTITPEPGYTVTCGFDSLDDMDWGETLWVRGERKSTG